MEKEKILGMTKKEIRAKSRIYARGFGKIKGKKGLQVIYPIFVERGFVKDVEDDESKYIELAKFVSKVPDKKNFYRSGDWLKLRYDVILKYGARCQCCGRDYKNNGVKINVDHIKPRHKYPELSLEFDNLQVLCEDCNLGKLNLDETDWR